MQGRVWAVAEGSPARGTQVGGAGRKDGQGGTDRRQKGASATRADCVPLGTHLPRQKGSQKTHSREEASL